MEYEVEEREKRTLIRQSLPKKSKVKKKNVNSDDYLVPVPVFTTELQPTVTCSTPYNWSATLYYHLAAHTV